MAKTVAKWVLRPQGRIPKLELAFERKGRVFAYLIPSDPRDHDCYEAMREITEILDKSGKVTIRNKKPPARAGKRG